MGNNKIKDSFIHVYACKHLKALSKMTFETRDVSITRANGRLSVHQLFEKGYVQIKPSLNFYSLSRYIEYWPR